jgi:anti-sigma B factor antagonist
LIEPEPGSHQTRPDANAVPAVKADPRPTGTVGGGSLAGSSVDAGSVDAGSVEGGCRVVAVAGVLDLLTIDQLEHDIQRLTAAGEVHIILDLSQVEMCDAAGMGGLVRVADHCAAAGGSLRLASPNGIVAAAFQIVSLDEDLPIHETVQAARSAAASGSTRTGSARPGSARPETLRGRRGRR